jgi:hypothetical protein
MVDAVAWGVGVFFDQTGSNQRRWQMQRPSAAKRRSSVVRTPAAYAATLARLAARFPAKVRPIH